MFGETAGEMSAEELLSAGREAQDAEDYQKAMEYFQNAAEKGDAEALFYIGRLYMNGNGVDQSYEKALEYFQRGADLGDSFGYTGLAWLYQNGFGVEQSYDKALEYYQQAADQGSAEAAEALERLLSPDKKMR